MTNRRLDRFAPLLQVPPASRGEPRGRGTPRFARGTERARHAPLREGNREGVARPALQEKPRRAPVRFPLLAGGTLRRGSVEK
jgi:hypothetical protein